MLFSVSVVLVDIYIYTWNWLAQAGFPPLRSRWRAQKIFLFTLTWNYLKLGFPKYIIDYHRKKPKTCFIQEKCFNTLNIMPKYKCFDWSFILQKQITVQNFILNCLYLTRATNLFDIKSIHNSLKTCSSIYMGIFFSEFKFLHNRKVKKSSFFQEFFRLVFKKMCGEE